LLPTEFLPGQRKLKEQNKTGGSDLNTAQIDFKRKVNFKNRRRKIYIKQTSTLRLSQLIELDFLKEQ
jgi:hypothetical protein